MPVSAKTLSGMKKSSWIRKMFEAGEKLRAETGEENVFDLSIGNPLTEPPSEFRQALAHLACHPKPGMHRYMPNAGYLHTRKAVASHLAGEFGLNFCANDVVMTCGAAGALNIALKTILNPEDEVIIISPYFPEYLSYIDNHGGRAVIVSSGNDFMPSIDKIESAFSQKTRAVIINTPNNPTGVVYSSGLLSALGQLLKRKSSTLGRPVFLISDEPYRKIVYDNIKFSAPVLHYRDTIITSSYSKDLSLPGERIGYLAVNPSISGKEELVAGFIYSNRILGFVNAPALAQNVITKLQSASVSIGDYQQKRDYLYNGLKNIGYEVAKPAGAFYVFPKVPGGDDLAYVNKLMGFGVLAVPGVGFGVEGYMRLSYCVSKKTIEGALEGLRKAFESVK